MRTLLERFNDKYTKTESGCWEWGASKHRQGYGRIRLGKKEGKTLQAHRVSYELFIGEIPSGKLVCHKCDNPACVNPDHLFLGTHKDNMVDKYEKGRQGTLPSGKEHWTHKRTPHRNAEGMFVAFQYGPDMKNMRKFI